MSDSLKFSNNLLKVLSGLTPERINVLIYVLIYVLMVDMILLG